MEITTKNPNSEPEKMVSIAEDRVIDLKRLGVWKPTVNPIEGTCSNCIHNLGMETTYNSTLCKVHKQMHISPWLAKCGNFREKTFTKEMIDGLQSILPEYFYMNVHTWGLRIVDEKGRIDHDIHYYPEEERPFRLVDMSSLNGSDIRFHNFPELLKRLKPEYDAVKECEVE